MSRCIGSSMRWSFPHGYRCHPLSRLWKLVGISAFSRCLIGLAYIFAHILSHYLYGGWWQLLRVFRPTRLAIISAVRPKPLLIALGVRMVFAVAIAATDWATRDILIMGRVNEAPKLEALLDDPVWSHTRPVFIQTQQGANLAGTGKSLVEVRAVQDGQKAYFAFRWEDPTRSLAVSDNQKGDGWHVLDIAQTGRMSWTIRRTSLPSSSPTTRRSAVPAPPFTG